VAIENTPLPSHPHSVQPGRRRRWLWLLAPLLLAALGWLYWVPVRGYSLTAASYGARVACSCRFVGGRPLGDCHKDMERQIGWVTLSEDDEAKSVSASFLMLARQTATYREGWGCQLEPWK
jgi:hypothetical protein